MVCAEIISSIRQKLPAFSAVSVAQEYPDEVHIAVNQAIFKDTCLILHKMLPSPVMMLFACDQRRKNHKFEIICAFAYFKKSQWLFVTTDISDENPSFDSLAKSVHSASLFEREIREMFGIEPKGNPDLRRLNLHDEVWPEGAYPLRKDFNKINTKGGGEYKFARVEGEGIFEVPVGPVHAGIIGPGHFRFSAAGEPIINLESRLGFTHRGVEKLFEGMAAESAVAIAERVCGDASFAHSLAFTRALEKICAASFSQQAEYIRAIFLELERMYNHVNDIGGMAVDVGFSFPAAYASIIKEAILQLNDVLTGSRYLKGANRIGGIPAFIDSSKKVFLQERLKAIKKDFCELARILYSSVSFMDRVDATGILRRATAEDLGIVGLAARASGIPSDLRKYFPGVYKEAGFKMVVEQQGDCLARLKVRVCEFEESCRLIEFFTDRIVSQKDDIGNPPARAGSGLGYAEGWRGPVLYWVTTGPAGLIERCKIVDPSFHNWQGLAYAVLGDIIPDFPLCNKSFDLSYSGNDL